jgi:hypothetical protein
VNGLIGWLLASYTRGSEVLFMQPGWWESIDVVIGEGCTCTGENILKGEWNIRWLMGIFGEETLLNLAAIFGVKTAPKHTVVFYF